MKNLSYFLFPTLVFMLFAMTSYAQVTPKKLAVYYGAPLNVNGHVPRWTAQGTDVSDIVAVFADYDLIVFGQDLEISLVGDDRANFIKVVTGLRNLNKEIFGYITLGVNMVNLTEAQIKDRVDKWKALGVTGIFLDEAGYDFGVSRDRQNDVIQYIHSTAIGMNAMVNAWIPADVLSGANELNSNDYYLLESFMVSTSSPIGFVPFYQKAVGDRYQSAKDLSIAAGNVKVATLTTTNFDSFSDCQENQLPYAWWSTFAYGFDAMGWGEKNFSSGPHGVGMANQLPFRTRPSVNPSTTSLTGNLSINNGIITQRTNNGLITINTRTHTSVYETNSGQKTVFPIYNRTTVELEECVPQGGWGQNGLYIESSNKGLSVCKCYNLPCNNSSLGKQSDGKWYIHSVPNCGMGGYMPIEVNVGDNCDPTVLDCIKNYPSN